MVFHKVVCLVHCYFSYILMSNDLINCSDLGKFVLFADDTNIFVCGHSYEIALQKANMILSSVSSYMHKYEKMLFYAL